MFINILQSNWKLIGALAVLGLAASFGFSLAQEPLYTAESRVLIRYIQTAGVDAFAASRAAGKIGQTLSEVARTELFMEKALKTPYLQNLSMPSISDPIARRRFWEQAVQVSVGIDSSILKISSRALNGEEAKQVVQAVTYVIMTQGDEFHGADGLVALTQVDAPAITKTPARPAVLARSVFGLFLGLLVGLFIGMIRFWSLASTAVTPTPILTEEPAKTNLDSETRQVLVDRPKEVSQPETNLSARTVQSADIVSKLSKPVAEVKEDVQTPNKQAHIGVRQESRIHTIFDDLMRLGLDPERIAIEA